MIFPAALYRGAEAMSTSCAAATTSSTAWQCFRIFDVVGPSSFFKGMIIANLLKEDPVEPRWCGRMDWLRAGHRCGGDNLVRNAAHVLASTGEGRGRMSLRGRRHGCEGYRQQERLAGKPFIDSVSDLNGARGGQSLRHHLRRVKRHLKIGDRVISPIERRERRVIPRTEEIGHGRPHQPGGKGRWSSGKMMR